MGKGKYSIADKMDMTLVIYTHLTELGRASLKLPHEMQVVGNNVSIGTQYDDIARSYYDGVNHFEAIMSPYFEEDYIKEIAKLDALPLKSAKDYMVVAKKKLSLLMRLSHQLNFALHLARAGHVIEDEEERDDYYATINNTKGKKPAAPSPIL